MAIEAIGAKIEYPEAESKRKETFLSHQTWEEGSQDRWRGRKPPTFTGSVVNATGTMCPHCVVVGTIVILCDGSDSEEAMTRDTQMTVDLTKIKNEASIIIIRTDTNAKKSIGENNIRNR